MAQPKRDQPTAPPIELPQEILWLVDAPMFIDEKQVEAFYDAILRPDYEGTSITLDDSLTTATKFSGGMTVGGAIPWLAKAEGTVTGERAKEEAQGEQATYQRVINPYRHLLALAIHYATQDELKERLVFATPSEARNGKNEDVSNTWLSSDFSEDTPRAVVMLKILGQVPLIPAALELTNGKVVPLFEDLAHRLEKPGKDSLPEYPSYDLPEDEQRRRRRDYWGWFVRNYDAQKARAVIEDAVESGPIAWIDYNLPVGSGDFLHLHIAARGQYETGTFAFNFITRGLNHGLRIVGTLKSEPDLNVLAIFER